VSCFIIIVIQWRTIYRYMVIYSWLFLFTILSIKTAIITLFIVYGNNINNTYVKFHLLWHYLVFYLQDMELCFRLNEEIYPIIISNQIDYI